VRRALVAASLAAACAGPGSLRVSVAEGATFELQPPASFGRSVALEQVVHFRGADVERSLHCLLEIEPGELRLVGLTAFDTPAFRVVLREGELDVEDLAGGALPVDPRRILADLQLALWPQVQFLDGLEVRERTEGGESVRELLRGGRTIVSVRRSAGEPWSKPLEYRHFERGYVLTVETLRCDTLAP
jgi:hypothetical protein